MYLVQVAALLTFILVVVSAVQDEVQEDRVKRHDSILGEIVEGVVEGAVAGAIYGNRPHYYGTIQRTQVV